MTTPALFNAAPTAITAAGPRPRIIGLDLSLTSTGVALPDGTTYRIKTRAVDADNRLVLIRDNIRRALATHRPHLAVVEDLPITANSAGITGMVHGIVRAELADAEVPRALIAAATLKAYAADNGRADKAQMAAAAYLAAGVQFPDDPGGDRCDAWWLRAAGHDWWGTPLFDLPDAQRARLTKAKWPVGVPRLTR
ncbi:crossover junction endodeoxyribonuclease RuvC [Streptomyces piniterrae]|uniref:crossover junction endodeoxyribonuclease RuvC n=1 Tax=Streptomyces piniterrae TaxID=2571125 RepID=UPI001FEA20FC|nr:crossover junction endodeoxyribonuclease RuvC [Streptomyces piniterrae]